MEVKKCCRRRLSGRTAPLICILVLLCSVLQGLTQQSLVQAEEKQEQEGKRTEQDWEGDTVYCVSFGDSIAKGYAGRGQEDLKSYTQLIADKISEETNLPSVCTKYAKNGLDSSGLNSKMLSMDEALAELDRADIITVTVGANDLLQECKGAAQEVLGTEESFSSVYDAFDAVQEGVESNPLLIMKVLDVLNDWDYTVFEEQWGAAMETIAGHRKAASQMIVTNIYNPVSKFELPGTMNSIVEDIIQNMNQIMYQHAQEYDYRVVDLLGSDICDYTQPDGLHPNQEGQELIAELALEKIDTGRFSGGPKKEIEEEPRPKKPVRRRYSVWTFLGPAPVIVLLMLTGLILAVLFWRVYKKRMLSSKPRREQKEDNSSKEGDV